MRSFANSLQSVERIDHFGAAASILCIVHCAICALLPAVFGTLGLEFLLGHGAEWVFTLAAVAFAAGALAWGWRRHRSVLVAALLALGIAGLLLSRGLEIGSEHHKHHGEQQYAALAQAGSHGNGAAPETKGGRAEHTQDHEDSQRNPKRTTHAAGTAVGVLAGLLLLLGHTFNFWTARRCGEGCCS